MPRVLAKLEIVGELLRFLWRQKLWWLIPMALVLLAVGLMVLLAQHAPLAPFIYPLF